MIENYLSSVTKQFEHYKQLSERTLEQLSDEQIFWKYNSESLSIASIIKHLHGNMLSRWTDFLTSDGEKSWRKRGEEFEEDNADRAEVLRRWEEGWVCLFKTLNGLTEDDMLTKQVLIRNEKHSVAEAINRQLAHYPYHVGQLVYLGKMMRNDKWTGLSMPKKTLIK